MRKKVYSIVLCLCLVLTLMPASVFAADDSSLPEGLYWCWPKRVSGNPRTFEYDPDESLRTDIQGGYPGSMDMVFIYLDDTHTRHRIPFSSLSCDAKYIELREEPTNCVEVIYNATGTGGKITYTSPDGKDFSINIDSEFWAWDFAFYKGSTATEEGFFNDYNYNGTDSVFYFVASNGCTITNCSVASGPDITTEIVNNTCVKLTIKKLDDSEELVLSFDGTERDGTSFSNREECCMIYDCQPGLYWRWPERKGWDGNKPILVSNPDAPFEKSLYCFPYGSSDREFLFRDTDGTVSSLTIKDLTTTSTFFEWKELCPGFVTIECLDFGEGTIVYNHNGTDYSLPIRSDLPLVGFYDEPVASKQHFLRNWDYKGTNNSIYLVARDNYRIDNISLSGCSATFVPSPDKKYATITMTELTWDTLDARFDVLLDGDVIQRDEGVGIGITDLSPGLYWSWPKGDWSTGDLVLSSDPDAWLQKTVNGEPYGVQDREFFFRDNDGKLTRLHCSDLVKTGDFFTIEDFQNDFIRMSFTDFNEGTLSYQGYSIRVICDLPDFGFYKASSASKDDFLAKWVYDGTSDKIYFVKNCEFTMSNLRWTAGVEVEYQLDSSGKFATAKLVGQPDGNYTQLAYDVTDDEGRTWQNNLGIEIVNNAPGLVWRWPKLDGNTWVSDPDEELNRSIYDDINYNMIREFFFLDADGNLTQLKASDLTASDDFIKMTQDDSGMIIIRCTDFGTGTISYGNYSIKVTSVLPFMSLYTNPEATEANYLAEWNPAQQKTVYIVPLDDEVVITDIAETTENNVKFEIVNGGKYVIAELEKALSDNLNCEITFHYNDGNDRTGFLGATLVLGQETESDPNTGGNGGTGGGGGSTPKPEEPATTPEEPAEQPIDDPLQEEVSVEVTNPETGETETVTVTKAAAEAAEKFDDVEPTDYFAEAVGYAVEKGITAGISESEFGPDQGCTRAQVVTFLWAANGSPEAGGETGFADVKDNAYYEEAVAWAVEQDITNGTGENEFSPEETVTRAQFIMMLWISQGKPEVEGGVPFEDVPADAYYAKAVAWAYANGITAGKSATSFGSDDPCTRGQIVTFLHVALDK